MPNIETLEEYPETDEHDDPDECVDVEDEIEERQSRAAYREWVKEHDYRNRS